MILAASAATPAHAQPNASPPDGITVTVLSTPSYDVTGSNVASINFEIAASSLSLTTNYDMNIESTFTPTFIGSATLVSGSSEPLSFQSVPGSVNTYSVVIPQNTVSFVISGNGTESGANFLWRYIIRVPQIAVFNPPVPLSTTTYFVVPSGNIVSQVYANGGATLPVGDAKQSNSASGQVTYELSGGAGLLILQSRSFLPASIAITVCALAVVALAALNLFTSGRQFFDKTLGGLRTELNKLGRRIRLPGSGKDFSFRKLFQPKKLLALFILCGIVMVAVGALGGPDPQVKAYVISGNQHNVPLIQTQLQKVAGNVQVITPSDDYSDFAVMSSVGDFNLVVFSSNAAAQLNDVNPYVLPNLANVPVILIGNTTTTPEYRTQIADVDPSGEIVYVGDVTNMNATEQSALATALSANARTNILGLSVSATDFKLILGFEAILSMALIFLGWAYLGSLTSESRTVSDLSHLVVVVAAGIFVFFFSESLYVVTSSLLAFPLSLHAVNSGAHITAISLLGFGGGSTPRLAAGFIGVLVGAVGAETGPTFKKTDFALVGGIALILLANPLYLGTLVYQGILLFYPIGSLAFGDAFSSSLTVKGFIYGIGSALGGGLNSTFVLSAGKILYFAGLVPLAYLKKMGRTTSVIALLFAALIIGDGGVRVGEMTPDKSEIAVLPGLVVGFAFAVAILAIAAVEKYVRGNWRSRA
ncbi:MAG: hypothetical protein OK449_05125 [Thaumarchaeota archaeon]|nr:hypothetical protein [Nitrososphaerota archaeon]